jgi:hypothetical protein
MNHSSISSAEPGSFVVNATKTPDHQSALYYDRERQPRQDKVHPNRKISPDNPPNLYERYAVTRWDARLPERMPNSITRHECRPDGGQVASCG